MDRERRDGEWAMLNKSIEELKGQTQKLEEQRHVFLQSITIMKTLSIVS